MKALQNFSRLCALVTLLFAAPQLVKAQLTFITNEDNTITITGYTGSNDVVVIPATTNGYPITSIGDNAFFSDFGLTNVTISPGITSIGLSAFWNCVNLASVAIPNSVTNIGTNAFNSCFSLTNVIIPAGVTSIGNYAFVYCTNLAAINVDSANAVYSSTDGVLFNKEQTILMQFPSGKSGSYSIPSSVTNLADEAFGLSAYSQYPFPYNVCAGLTNLIVPGSIVDLSVGAFSHCTGLMRVTLLNGVTSIGTNAFSWCVNLANITLPNSITSIGDTAFYYNGLINVTIPKSVTNFGVGVFAVCTNLTTVSIQDGVSRIEEGEFNFCYALTNISIPDSITSIGDRAFWFCSSLPRANIPGNVTNIGQYGFSGCTSLMSIEVSTDNLFYSSIDGVLFNRDQTTLIQFPGAKGGSYTIPIGVTNIGNFAFESLDPYYTDPPAGLNLTNITIPPTITSIGNRNFHDLINLTSIHWEGNIIVHTDDIPDDIILFYLPGATGLPSFYPSVQWLPELQTGDNSSAGQANNFSFNVNWARGQTIVVEACTNLLSPNWRPVQTNILQTSSDYFSDPQWTNYSRRFYRIRSPE